MSKVEEHIRRAMEEGKFEDLPGKGKPLNLDENPLEDPDWRVANHLLRSGGFTLPWIDEYREIEKDLEIVRANLARTWNWQQASLTEGEVSSEVDYEWEQAVIIFKGEIAALNQRIFSYNMAVPVQSFQKSMLNADREITRLTSPKLSDRL